MNAMEHLLTEHIKELQKKNAKNSNCGEEK